MIMNLRLSVAAIAALVALGRAAEADILVGGPGDAREAQLNGTLICSFFNGGSNAVSINTPEIWSSTVGRVAIFDNTCRSPLAPQKTCQYASKYLQRAIYACRAITGGVEENIFGTMQIYSSTGQLLLSLPMRK
jgi:hypothetical protein